jgi:hypothetical protein
MPTLREINLAAGQISEAEPLIWQNVEYASRTGSGIPYFKLNQWALVGYAVRTY